MSQSESTLELAVRCPLLPSTTTINTERSSSDRNDSIVSLLPFSKLLWSVPCSVSRNPALTSQPGSASLLPLIGTLSSGIINCSGI